VPRANRARAITDIRSLARGATRLAIKTLTGVCSCPEAPHGARVQAAVALLDRGWGKPQQDHSLSGNQEILVTIRHLVEGSADTTKTIDVTPNVDDDSVD
jgi:hypothetical protein